MSNYIQMRGIFKPGGGFEPSVMFLRPFLRKVVTEMGNFVLLRESVHHQHPQCHGSVFDPQKCIISVNCLC